MKANELRVGNWVNNGEEDYQVTSATILHLERGDSIAQPILLTPKWLIRFGFKENKPNWFDSQDNVISYSFKEKLIKIGDMGFFPIDNVKYVHQIQNVYFAITGYELKIVFN